MPEMRAKHSAKSQMGYQASAESTYTQAGVDIPFVANQRIFHRIQTWVPPAATITNAYLTYKLTVKNQGATQNSSHRIRAHASGDSPLLRVGVSESVQGPRPETSAYVDWTAQWDANPSGPTYSTVNVTSIVQELVNRPDFQPGAYVTFNAWCTNENGSDMGVIANHDFEPYPHLTVEWLTPTTDIQHTINRCENSEFSTEIQAINSAGDSNPIPYWTQGDFYNTWVNPENFGTIERDVTITRKPGIPSLKFTCGVPPLDASKPTGPLTFSDGHSSEPFIFCGWILVGSEVPTTSQVWVGEPFHHWAGSVITARNTWVPFCTTPVSVSGEPTWTVRRPAVGVRDYQQGWRFWISEPTILDSGFRQMPFNGLTPDLKTPAGSTLIEHRSTASKQQSSRVWVPRTAVRRNNTPRRVPRFVKRSDGILQLAEPVDSTPLV